ncbi:exported hypothetical protein [Nostocoides australiense Ben110]|uniref:Uncharacterized protein n=1 Tax=Nostocoides australiense Ben110 TaxID=1193182 RepID=W6JT14_9MICO|nr:hypothetical protein [Tetrasphaera australiensis]CCH71571.1 exported hypothetical protein [Tetrasphaera australiensis Ben110]
MRRWLALLLLWAALGAAGLAVARASVPAAPPADVARANDLAQIAAEHWPSLARNDFPSDAPPFAVVAADGRVVLDAGAGVRDDVSAYAARALGLDVVTDGGSVARIYVVDPYADLLADRARRARDIALWSLAARVAVVARPPDLAALPAASGSRRPGGAGPSGCAARRAPWGRLRCLQ